MDQAVLEVGLCNSSSKTRKKAQKYNLWFSEERRKIQCQYKKKSYEKKIL